MECPYCLEFKEKLLRVGSETFVFNNRTLLETKNFIVFPTLGCFTEGYLLIATRKHYNGLGHIPSSFHEELEAVMNKLEIILSKAYNSQVIFFEHGATQHTLAGNSIVHAHIHAVPIPKDVEIDDIIDDLSQRYKHFIMKSFCQLQELYKENQSYLLLGNNDKKFVFKVDNQLPSQFLRQQIAKKLGIKDWNWREFPELESLKRTITKLKPFFK